MGFDSSLNDLAYLLHTGCHPPYVAGTTKVQGGRLSARRRRVGCQEEEDHLRVNMEI